MTTDIQQELQQLYRARQTPELLDVPELGFLMIDGHGDPNTSSRFQEAVQALYAVSYTLRFALKRAGGSNYRVAPLEGLWWAEDMSRFTIEDKAAWDWTLMIRQPPEVTPQLMAETTADVAEKKHLQAARELRLERFAEGLAAQVLHLGPYAAEAPTIERLHVFIAEQGYARRGMHHEIYLGDPRRAAPERLKTIIRQPVSET
jgi:hypothetical protein